MKMSQMKWWTLLLLITIGLVSPACSSKNDPDDDEEETEELTGVITVNMRNESQGNTSIEILTKSGVTAGYLRISNENNFETSSRYYLYEYTTPSLQICDVGVKKMEKVTNVPTKGWVTELAVEPKHSYVIKAIDGYEQYNSQRGGYEYVATGKITYYRLYVTQWTVNTSGGILGAQVQYCEWKTTGK